LCQPNRGDGAANALINSPRRDSPTAQDDAT